VALSNDPLTLMTSAASSDPGVNPFPSMWFDAVRRSGVDVRPWSSRGLLWSRPDVVHLHWPERVFGQVGRSPSRAATMAVRLAVLLAARARGSRVVWTVHNLAPHDQRGDLVGRAGVWCFQRLVDEFWVMSNASSDEVRLRFGPKVSTLVVKHPTYPVHGARREPPGQRRVLSFGEIRPYRGFLELVASFDPSASGSTLTLVGAGRGDEHSIRLREAVDRSPSTSWLDGRLDDEALHEEIRRCDVVVLNYQRVTNSGAALLALSLDRPVILPETPVFRELRDEVGGDWVFLFQDDPMPAIDACLDRVRRDLPRLERRGWDDLGSAVRQAGLRLRAQRGRRLSARL